MGEMSAKAAGGPSAQREAPSTLGADLTRAREQRGRSRENVASETHIPVNYVRMIESDDYSMIADQLYMLPFVRRYAAYLGMDEDEAAMRFVREVQRADNNPPPRLDHPLDGGVRRRSRRSSVFMVALAVLVIVIGLYFYFSPHHGSVNDEAPGSPPANAGARIAPAGSSSAPQNP
jgi:cytoskeletal protein RodZ